MKVKIWPYPKFIAHRGAGKLAPENTLAAMRMGCAHGYRMVEFDVKLSGDGVLILMHDATLERTTNGQGRVAEKTYAEIAKLDAGSWHSSEFAGEPVPTFAHVADYCITNGVSCNIEIKPCPGRERETGAAAALEAQLLWRKTKPFPLLSSFSEEALQAALEVAPELPRALLLEAMPADWKKRLARLHCVALNLDQRELSKQIVTDVHRAGYKLVTYTVNEPPRVKQILAWGVESLITDTVLINP